MKNKLLQAFTEALELEDVEVSLKDTIQDFDNWDSISKLSLIAILDDYFDVEISNAEFDTLETVQDLYDLVKSKSNNG
jgi:acyl carrier protein